uniref:Uncharacterized protein n=2 Tax=unclassified Caudoviricetes TaxID=2788787 RepID=A0A8S5P8T1_9CAUD|nr:MAG TPA: hypothetical protein [Siphoviridae sp. ctPat53]DAE10397.1 MAG TPA: hypothetical protein [Siphoviridae sp. ct7cV26]
MRTLRSSTAAPKPTTARRAGVGRKRRKKQ